MFLITRGQCNRLAARISLGKFSILRHKNLVSRSASSMPISHCVWRNNNRNKQKLENLNNRGVQANHFRNFFCGRPQNKLTGNSYEIVNKFRWSIDLPNRFVETDRLWASVSTLTANEVIDVANVKRSVVIHLTNVNSYTYQLAHL
jgi:hypothetical protein